jgi:hypothetical protein
MSKIKTLPGGMALREKAYSIPTLHAEVPVEFDLADVLVPGAWAHHAAKVRKGHEIVVRRVDLAWRVHLQVTDVGVGFLRLHVLSKWENPDHAPAPREVEDGPLPELPTNYKVTFAPKAGWVARTIDPPNTVATKPTRTLAHLAAIEHARLAEGIAA